jgi:general secretion pathway protein N
VRARIVAAPAPLIPPRGSWAWALAGAALGLVCALALFAPARWLTAPIEQAAHGRLLLGEPRGTVWTGSAELIFTGGEGSKDAAALPTRVEWRIRPRWNGFVAQLNSPCCTEVPVRLRVLPRWSGARVAVADGRSRWPAGILVGLGTPWNTLQIDGELLLATEGLSVEWVAGRLAIAGRAELTAQRMSSRLSTLRPMGSYRITLSGGETPALQLQTLEGSLQLTGSGRWVGSRLHFSGIASAAPDRETALSNLLNIIGRRNGARSIITIG